MKERSEVEWGLCKVKMEVLWFLIREVRLNLNRSCNVFW